MAKVISNFDGFEELKQEIVGDAVVSEEWEYPKDYSNFKKNTGRCLHNIEKNIGSRGKYVRRTFNCVMELLQISVPNNEGDEFNAKFAFSFKKDISKSYLGLNTHTHEFLKSRIDFLDDNDLDILNGGWQIIYRDLCMHNQLEDLSYLHIIKISRNPIYYRITPQEGKNPLFELIVRIEI